MRVAIVTTSYPLRIDSSSGIFISRLVAHLPGYINKTVITPCSDYPVTVQRSTNTRLQCFRYAPWSWQVIAHQPGGIPVALRTHRWLILLLPFLLLSMLLACIRAGCKSDLLHANWSLNGLIAGLAGKLTGTPVITTLRGSDVDRLEHSIIRRLVLRGCLCLNCRVITVSDAIRIQVCKRFPKYRARVSTIANGVSEEFIKLPVARTDNRGTLQITSIGSLIPRKCTDTLIRAVAGIKDISKLRLNIIGDGPERVALQAMAKKAESDGLDIVFPGNLPPDKIPGVLALTDVFVLASHAEGRPNVVLEAMAAGIPVVASDIEGVRELIQHGETGLLFPSGDNEALIHELERLLNDAELRQQLGQSARQFIFDHGLTWQQCAANYTALYKTCCRNKPNHR